MARRRQPDRYTSHSCTDSGIGGVNNDYSRQRIPSTFQSYDTYRAKKEDRQVRMADDLLAVRDNGIRGLSSDDSAQFDDSVTRALLDNTFGVIKAHPCDKKRPGKYFVLCALFRFIILELAIKISKNIASCT